MPVAIEVAATPADVVAAVAVPFFDCFGGLPRLGGTVVVAAAVVSGCTCSTTATVGVAAVTTVSVPARAVGLGDVFLVATSLVFQPHFLDFLFHFLHFLDIGYIWKAA